MMALITSKDTRLYSRWSQRAAIGTVAEAVATTRLYAIERCMPFFHALKQCLSMGAAHVTLARNSANSRRVSCQLPSLSIIRKFLRNACG